MVDEFVRQSVALSLKKMFEGRHFNICAVDTALSAMKISPNRQQYDALRALHCVDFGDMDPQLREQVFLRTLALFADATSFNFAAIDQAFGPTALPFNPEKRAAIGLLPWHRRA